MNNRLLSRIYWPTFTQTVCSTLRISITLQQYIPLGGVASVVRLRFITPWSVLFLENTDPLPDGIFDPFGKNHSETPCGCRLKVWQQFDLCEWQIRAFGPLPVSLRGTLLLVRRTVPLRERWTSEYEFIYVDILKLIWLFAASLSLPPSRHMYIPVWKFCSGEHWRVLT